MYSKSYGTVIGKIGSVIKHFFIADDSQVLNFHEIKLNCDIFRSFGNMSKDIVVVTPNGRRQKIQCSPNTSMLQVLEDVCAKHGFQPKNYDLKHHNHIIDLSSTVRWSNLPNKATLEMVEAENSRQETNVTIGLLLEDGERRTAEFSPNTSLFELVISMAPDEFHSLTHPSILYMRQEVKGEVALKGKTLRQLGLIRGRAVLRLLNKSEQPMQANVSAIYRVPLPMKDDKDIAAATYTPSKSPNEEMVAPGPSEIHKKYPTEKMDPLNLIKKEKETLVKLKSEAERPLKIQDSEVKLPSTQPVKNLEPRDKSSSSSLESQTNLERRLTIEEEVKFLGEHKAIAFIPKGKDDEFLDLPDDFYELTVEEVRRLYSDLQNHRLQLEETPLMTAAKKDNNSKDSLQRLSAYKNVVVRVQFPDHVVLQGIFTPTDTIQDVIDFVKNHLQTPDKPFHMFTTPIKETLNPDITLLEAKFVPCVHMHFKWMEEEPDPAYLKKEIYSEITACDAACIMASKYRAPSRKKQTDNSQASGAGTSSAKNSKVPRWFRN